MPTLHWIGKDKVINHHLDVPFKVLERTYTFSSEFGLTGLMDKKDSLGTPKDNTPAIQKSNNPTNPNSDNESGNKIINGDNLEALKSLLPQYEGQIKCIYIDPPYNTGNENWVYNDNVNDPKIKKWLGEVVGKESEDLSRHDKWLCMMYPRLKLLHKLLADDGAIFISIDDNEQANLKLICDEILGGGNFISTVIWEKNDSPKMDSTNFSNKHDFILVYSKNLKNFKINQLNSNSESQSHYNKTDLDGRKYYLKPLRAMGGQGETRLARPTLYYPIISPDGSEVYPKRKDGSDGAWRWSKDKVETEISRIVWTNAKGGWNPNYKIFADSNSTKPPETIWYHTEVGSNRTSKSEINTILKETSLFNTPKPIKLLERVIEACSDKNSIILDSFAGSGTTAHAVLNLNKQDGGNRKFILVEMEDYAETITAERVKRVINGYADKEETGGSFDFYKLGEALFLEDGNLNESVETEKIRKYIWYTETKTALLEPTNKDNSHYLSTNNNTAYYFYYDKEQITTLNHDFLASLKTKAEQYVIYADNCLLTKAFMTKHNIIFKKIPRDITKF
jgi:adenine-specific DNA-methyltransferase